MCCQVEVTATGLSLDQRNPIESGFSDCNSEASMMRSSWSTRDCYSMRKENNNNNNNKLSVWILRKRLCSCLVFMCMFARVDKRWGPGGRRWSNSVYVEWLMNVCPHFCPPPTAACFERHVAKLFERAVLLWQTEWTPWLPSHLLHNMQVSLNSTCTTLHRDMRNCYCVSLNTGLITVEYIMPTWCRGAPWVQGGSKCREN